MRNGIGLAAFTLGGSVAPAGEPCRPVYSTDSYTRANDSDLVSPFCVSLHVILETVAVVVYVYDSPKTAFNI